MMHKEWAMVIRDTTKALKDLAEKVDELDRLFGKWYGETVECVEGLESRTNTDAARICRHDKRLDALERAQDKLIVRLERLED